LQFLKYDRKHGTILSFTTGLDQDEEVSELEAIKKVQPGNDLHSIVSGGISKKKLVLFLLIPFLPPK